MIAREWKCRCPRRHREGFLAYLDQTGVKDTRAMPGFQEAQILQRELDDQVEITFVTYWDSLESIKSFAGEDIETARLYPEDSEYELDPDTRVIHYEVVRLTIGRP